MRIRLYWLFIFLLITLGAFFFFKAFQPPLSYDFAPQFDGNDYRGIYDYFTGTSPEYRVSFPFHSRILVPGLAAILGSGDIITDFRWLNLFFSLLSVGMLFILWRDLGFERKWFFFSFFWLLFHWTGIIRLNAFDPVTVDVPLYFFQTAFLWVVLKRKFGWLLVLGPLATLQKESFIALLAVLSLYGWYHDRTTKEGFYDLKWIIGALILSVLTKEAANVIFPPVESGRSSFVTILYHLRETLYQPFNLIRWITAFFMAFGPVLLLAAFYYISRRYYENTRNLLLIFSMVYAFFGIFAGGDMTRIIYLGFPFLMSWAIYELQEIGNGKLVMLILLSLPLTMLHRSIPDPAFQWELWISWYPEFAPVSRVLLYFGYALVSLLLISFPLFRKPIR